jgi:hypothetical protein
LGLLRIWAGLLKDFSLLGRQGVNVLKLLRLLMPPPRALQGRRSLLPQPGIALGV